MATRKLFFTLLLALLVLLLPGLSAAQPGQPATLKTDPTGSREESIVPEAESPNRSFLVSGNTTDLERIPVIAQTCEPVVETDLTWQPTVPRAGEVVTLTATIWPSDTGWFTRTVDDTGEHGSSNTSIAIDAAGRPHIAYFADDSADLRYTWYDGKAWHIETVDSTSQVGYYASLKLDQGGHPHISYSENANRIDSVYRSLKYAWHDGTRWYTETVDGANDATVRYTSLALDSAGLPHISYYYNGYLKYARYDGSAWQTERVDPGDDTGYYTSIVLDTGDHPHISYSYYGGPGALKYAWHDGSSWHIETAFTCMYGCMHTSLALDAAGYPHISYQNDDTIELKYSYFDGTSWHIESIDGWNTGAPSSLVLDSADRPHIGYTRYIPMSQLEARYAWYDGATWHIEVIDPDAGSSISLALDQDGLPHASYRNYYTGELRYARWQDVAPTPPITYTWDLGDGTLTDGQVISHSYTLPGTYTVTATATNCVSATATVVRSIEITLSCFPVTRTAFSWTPTIPATGQSVSFLGTAGGDGPISFTWSFGDGSEASGAAVSHAYALSGTYSVRLTATNGCGRQVVSNTVLVLDGPCNPLYGPAFTWSPYFPLAGQTATFRGSVGGEQGWVTEIVEAGSFTGWNNSLALDSANRPHVLYCQGQSIIMPCLQMHYARRDGSGWHVEILAYDANPGHESLDTDTADHPHLCYQDTANDDLKYAYYNGTSWQTFTPDSTGNVGASCSLVLDRFNRPRISYYTCTDLCSLKYAWYDGSNWQIEMVDPSGNLSGSTSLALDANGYPHISYANEGTSNDLKYAWYDGSGWQIGIVDHNQQTGLYSSLKIDILNYPHISYLQINSPEGFKYASFDGIQWTTEMIGAASSSTSLALDILTRPHIAYCSYHTSLEYAYYDGTRWTADAIDPDAHANSVSIALDRNANPRVSYRSDVDNALHYAYFIGSATPPVAYDWSWGDGTVGSGQTAQHSYSAPGTYTVVMTATNCTSATATHRHTISVLSLPCDPITQTEFFWTPFTPTVGEAVFLTGSASGTLPISYTWDLGDGTAAMGITMTHVYTVPGVYTVTLTTANECGEATITHAITILPTCDPVTGTIFAWMPLTPTVGQVVTLAGSASGTLPISFTWDLGDGTVAAGATVTHSYSLPGSYPIRVTAVNSCGQEIVTQTIGVLPLPCEPVTGTVFSWTPLTPTEGQVVTFTASAGGTAPISYTWAFGEGITATGQVATHTYALPGSYTVTLLAANGCGQETVTHTITVDAACEPVVGAEFEWVPVTGTVGEGVVFNGTVNPWRVETVDDDWNSGTYSSLVLDANGQPHISYSRQSELWYVYYGGSGWRTEQVDWTTWALDTSLALDSEQNPHICYFKALDVQAWLRYARFDGSRWISETIAGPLSLGSNVSLALDRSGSPHISYSDCGQGKLHYIYFDGTIWHDDIVDQIGPWAQGTGLSLALDRGDRPHISYSNSVGTSLRYAYYDGLAWITETVDSTLTGLYSSLALDSLEHPHISHYGHLGLSYAYYDGSDWRIEVIESGPNVGLFPSLVLDSRNRPHVSYYDTMNGLVKYTCFDGVDWRTEVIDSHTDGGSSTSLVLDSQENPHISYRGHYNLRYASSQGTSTQPLTLTWSFGDGALEIGETVTHTYALPGVYTVTLTATNGCGEATVEHAVTVVQGEWKAYLPVVIKHG